MSPNAGYANICLKSFKFFCYQFYPQVCSAKGCPRSIHLICRGNALIAFPVERSCWYPVHQRAHSQINYFIDVLRVILRNKLFCVSCVARKWLMMSSYVSLCTRVLSMTHVCEVWCETQVSTYKKYPASCLIITFVYWFKT